MIKKNNYDSKYYVRLKKNPNGKIKFREYDKVIYKNKDQLHKSDYDSIKSKNIKKGKIDLKTISKRSLARTRNRIIETIENNEDRFITFITLTFAENIIDVDFAYKCLCKYIRKVKKLERKQNRDLFYLIVPEFQKRGAIHYHCLISIPCNTVAIPKRKTKIIKSEGKIIRIKYYALPYWDHGYSTAIPITRDNDNFNLSLYLIKYLYKDLDNRLFGRQKVYVSQNLRRPIITYLNNPDIIEQFKKENINNEVSKYSFDKKNKYQPSFIEIEYWVKDKK